MQRSRRLRGELTVAPSVGATNWSGAVAATRHVLDLGHRRIAVLSGPGEFLCARQRLEACRAALEISGVPLESRQPFRDIGAAAADLLLALIAGDAPARTRIELPTTLVVRASTAPPPSTTTVS